MSGRFAKGQSGNPSGRPRLAKPPPTSAFDIIIDRTLTVTQNGRERELTIDEALQQKTYQDAIGGSRLAQREIMKMIEKREKAMTVAHPRNSSVIVKKEQPPPANANAALLLLDIVQSAGETYPRTAMTTWAVQLALDRSRGQLTQTDLDAGRRDTLTPNEVRWPKRASS